MNSKIKRKKAPKRFKDSHLSVFRPIKIKKEANLFNLCRGTFPHIHFNPNRTNLLYYSTELLFSIFLNFGEQSFGESVEQCSAQDIFTVVAYGTSY